ncbi:cupin domain-containing protein [Wenyingzhuangia sp. IMCC45574]
MKKTLLFIFAATLFACQKEYSTKIKKEQLVKTTKSWNGEKLPAYKKGQPEVQILKFTIPPKTKLHWHKHLVINAGVLIKGTLDVHDEYKNVLHLKAGDAIVELVNTYHYGENTGDIPAEIIVVYAGTEGVPITVLKE